MEMKRQGEVSPAMYLFASRKGIDRPLRPGQARYLLRQAYDACRLYGEIIEPHSEKNVWVNRL
jgi:hypothetical protein